MATPNSVHSAKQLSDCLPYAICGFAGTFLLAGCLMADYGLIFNSSELLCQTRTQSVSMEVMVSLRLPNS